MSARKDWRKTSFGEGDDWWLSASFTALSAVTLYPLSYSRNWAVVVLVGRKTSERSLNEIPAVLFPQYPGACAGLGKNLFLRETFQTAQHSSPKKWHLLIKLVLIVTCRSESRWRNMLVSCLCVDESKGAIAQWKDPVGREGSQWSLWALRTDPTVRGQMWGPGEMLHFSTPHCKAHCVCKIPFGSFPLCNFFFSWQESYILQHVQLHKQTKILF